MTLRINRFLRRNKFRNNLFNKAGL